jgi:hypothetical protein
MTVLMPTPKWAAAAFRDIPPFSSRTISSPRIVDPEPVMSVNYVIAMIGLWADVFGSTDALLHQAFFVRPFSRMLAGLAPRASSPSGWTAPIDPVRARSGSRSATGQVCHITATSIDLTSSLTPSKSRM